MLLFCPGCGNGLIVEEGQRCHRFACNTCPYVHNVTRKVGPRGRLSRCLRPQPSRCFPVLLPWPGRVAAWILAGTSLPLAPCVMLTAVSRTA